MSFKPPALETGSGRKTRPGLQPLRMVDLMAQNAKTLSVQGPDGQPLTKADLPSPGIRRWVTRRKAEVVAAVNGGLLSVDEACARYNLTLEEFAGWQRAVDRSGMPGLRVTRVQHYRSLYERQQRF